MKKTFLILVLQVLFFAALYAAEFSGVSRPYKIGDFEFMAVRDKDTNMGKSILLNPDADIVRKMMPDNQNPASINAFVVKNKDGKIALIDAGTEGGNVLNNLESAGIKPEDVNYVLITHMHGDHVGGLLNKDKGKAFPNAEVYVSKAEIDYWTNTVAQDAGTSSLARSIKGVYGKKIKNFTWGEDIIPGVKPEKAVGHTPGHTVYEISSKGEKILVIGDVIHSLKVQMADPSMAVKFDVDPRQAVEVRKQIFRDVARSKTKIAGMHIPFPGVGTISDATTGSYTGVYFFNPAVK